MAALEAVLGDHFGVTVQLTGEPTRISGGFWAAIYGFEVAADTVVPGRWRGRLVLRVMPDRVRAVHEIIVQRTIADAGFMTPPVLLDGFDENLGGAFMIMPFSPGRSPLSGLGLSSLLRFPQILRRLPIQLAQVAVSLHEIDPTPLAAALEVAGIRSSGDGGESRLDAIRVAAGTESEGFEQLLGWFIRHRPRHPALVVCHGDLHPFNLLVERGAGQRTTVLDWTNGDLMPREFDVGFTAGFLRCAPISVPTRMEPVMRRLTRWLSHRFVSAYAANAPLDPQMVAWFEALQYARCLAEVATARSGLTDIVGEKHPFETSADAMIRRLGELTGIRVSLPPRRSDEAV